VGVLRGTKKKIGLGVSLKLLASLSRTENNGTHSVPGGVKGASLGAVKVLERRRTPSIRSCFNPENRSDGRP